MKLYNKVFRFLFFLFLCCFFQTEIKAQKTYGFEWIKTYQPYVKFNITKKGLYRIDSLALLSWNNKDPRKFQLFKNGVEQPIFIQGAADGVFNASDFIEIYAEPNDGLGDKEIYRTAAEQPQTFRSIFSDTGVYFLTVLPDTSLVQPLRLLPYTDNDYSNYLPEPRYSVLQTIVPQEDYYYGTFLPAVDKYYISDYGEAEGMMSALIGQSQSRGFTFKTPLAASGQNASLEIKILGASDFFLPNANAPNHHVKIFVQANNGSKSLIIDSTFRGYGEQKFNRIISNSLLGDSTVFIVEVINDIAVGSDFIGVSYIQLDYLKTNQSAGFEEFLQLNATQIAAKTLVQLNNFSGSNPIVWDFKNLKRSVATKNAGNALALLPYSAGPRNLIAQEVSQIRYLTNIKQVNFVAPNPQIGYQYLIVSNKSLTNSAEAYKNYRNTKYTTYLAYIEDLCDYYFYGNYHPLAIKHFAQHLFDKQVKSPDFLLLLGRGYQNNLLKASWETNALNLVPALGVPSSDNLFTNGFLGNSGAPSIATGRIPASTNAEANSYLQKLIYYESNPDSIQAWRKEYLHLNGGSSSSQQLDFKQKLASLGDLVSDMPVGANVLAFGKDNSAPTSDKLKEKVLSNLNNGVNMMTFYGHGSLTVLDVDFGGIDDLIPNNKPSFYYFNGCNIGNANDVDPQGTGLVYGKNYLCADAKGAIAWLAHTNLTFTNNLEDQMNQVYEQIAHGGYGNPFGLNLKKALENTSNGNEPFARSHALQLLLQGDPAMVLYAPALPDYKISKESLFISPNNASVQNDSLAIGIILQNLGKAQNDSLTINITRKFPDNSTKEYPLSIVLSPYNKDTFYVWIKPLFKKDIGLNTFDVKINASKKVTESSYANNDASIAYFLPGSGVQALLPHPYEIINTDSATMWIQNFNPFVSQVSYVFEIDTSLAFSTTSSYFQNSGPIIADQLASWKAKLKGPDSTVYYWRAKLNLPENEGGIWVTNSFIYVPNGPQGWHQQRFEQIKNASAKTFITFNDSLKKIEFSNNELVLGIENRRYDHRRMGVIIPYLLNAGVGSCISQGTVVLVFEPFQVDFPYELPNYPFNCAFVQANKQDQSIRYYPFNTNTPQGEADLARLIDSVPDGYYVAMFSRYSSNIPYWSNATKQLFSKIGSVKVQQVLNPNTAWAVIGKKGEAPGLAAEDTITNNELQYAPNLPPAPNDPQDEKYLRVKRNIQLKWYTGSFVSALVGPATKYNELNLILQDDDPIKSGSWWLDIYGTSILGKDTLLLSGITSNKLNLANIDAKKFPFLKLQMNFVDSNYRTPQQIHFWQVSYDGAPELSIDINKKYAFHSDLLNQGDSLRLSLPIINLGNDLKDSTDALIEVMAENRTTPFAKWEKVPPILAMQNYQLNTAINSSNLNGNNSLQVNVNANKKVAEANFVNNFYKKNFVVQTDKRNPLLEVTFDGVRIMNDDIVSPSPSIRISSTDKNAFMIQKDTTTFELYLRKCLSCSFERVNMSSSQVQFIPGTDVENLAQVIYKPSTLADGKYTLKVQSFDASGNKAGTKDYEVVFTVVNKSTISYFYPYPNPFTTQMRFVFTLTGSKVPDQLLVRILTVNGKIVREIRKEEFGNIHIGNNVSDFAWDGTDQYGDKLANGVYLYQVYTKIEGNDIENRATKAKEESSFFVNGTGKIFLMR